MSMYDSQSALNTPEPAMRKVSSVVVSERYLDEDFRKEHVKYIEVRGCFVSSAFDTQIGSSYRRTS